ncbi:MAG: CPBP family intramembrane metalloprotease, partial [Pedobacter sp.]
NTRARLYNPVQFFPALLLGLFFGFLYMKTNSLGLVILLHFTANLTVLIGGYLSYILHDTNTIPYFNWYGPYTIYIVGICLILFATACYFFYVKVSSLVGFVK